VKAYQAKECYGLVWVSLGQPEQDVPPFPEWEDESFRKVLCGPYEFNASAPRTIENFLDIAHFPFVHAGILGDENRPEIADYEVEIRPTGVYARDVRVWQPNPYGTGVGDTVVYTYAVYRPLTAYLTKESTGPRFAILFTVTPHEAVKSTGWMWMAMNYGEGADDELVRWQDAIVAQDRPVVESQRPELLPLDLQAELHLRSDRTAIAYRKWLADVGLTFGTS
jgi:phenylpropionate dioxygenase-like ring-hydroxylating dioxygenase large terminal subunit